MASIKKRGKTFQITVSLGRDSNNKQILKQVTYTPDPSLTLKQQQKSAQAYAIQYEHDVRTGQVIADPKLTVADFCTQWLADYALPQFSTGTYEKTERIIEQQIIPHLGHIRLADLRKVAIVHWLNQLASPNCKRFDGRVGGYQRATIQRYFGILHTILQTAVDWELLPNNPSDNVKLPKNHSATANEGCKCLSFEEVSRLLVFMQEPYTVPVRGHSRIDDTGIPYDVPDYIQQQHFTGQDRLLIHLGIDSGLRKQEILALTWKVIDFKGGTIHIKQAIGKIRNTEVVKALKNKYSKRTISVSQESLRLLQEWYDHQTHCRQTIDPTYNVGNWVFIRPDGERLGYSTPYQVLQKVIHHYNKAHPDTPLPAIGFHGLRHTCATLLLASGIDIREVAARLGHAETSTALNIYIHALPSSDKAAASKMDSILSVNPSC